MTPSLLDERQHEESSTAVHGRILVEMLIKDKATGYVMRQACVRQFESECRLSDKEIDLRIPR
jgi:hypothetical protein